MHALEFKLTFFVSAIYVWVLLIAKLPFVDGQGVGIIHSLWESFWSLSHCIGDYAT